MHKIGDELMKIFVINCGSSSLKYQLFEMNTESSIAEGKVEGLGKDELIFSHKSANKKEVLKIKNKTGVTNAIQQVFDYLVDPNHGIISEISEIKAVGHRVVHGGELFTESILVDDKVKAGIREMFELAPLHNPANLAGIEAIEKLLPGIPNVIVFDTTFHKTIPEKAYMYPIPKYLYEKHRIRRYGFQGISHRYVSIKAAEFLGVPLESMKIISCHIGNGASIAAIKHGESVDTSMGMTPLEGLMMGTRSGDIDPAIIPIIMEKEKLTAADINSLLNLESGLLAISGYTGDMRDIVGGMDRDKNNKLAYDMFEYRLRKYIGAYAAVMNGIDTIIFTAGIGENNPILRKNILENLSYLGVKVDQEANEDFSNDIKLISMPESKIDALVISTNEELMIARDTLTIVKSN